jgi:hypothetical protein
MTDFNFQSGVVNFEPPVVIPNFLAEIQTINQNIISQAMMSQFNYVYPTIPYLPNQQMPDEAYALVTHFIKRGFVVSYDGVAATITIAWDHPEMSDLTMSQITYAAPSVLPTLGGWFEAGVVYLCETAGVDLRSASIVSIKRNIQYSVEQNALLGLTTTSWGYPTVPSSVIENLYADVFTQLNLDGFGYTYNTVTGLYSITWGGQISFNFIEGSSVYTDMATFPADINAQFFQGQAGSPLNAWQVVYSSAGLIYPASTSVKAQGTQIVGLAPRNITTTGDMLAVQYFGLAVNTEWDWSDGAIYVAPDGTLTQNPSSTGWLLNVGTVVSPTSFIIDLGVPIFR